MMCKLFSNVQKKTTNGVYIFLLTHLHKLASWNNVCSLSLTLTKHSPLLLLLLLLYYYYIIIIIIIIIIILLLLLYYYYYYYYYYHYIIIIILLLLLLLLLLYYYYIIIIIIFIIIILLLLVITIVIVIILLLLLAAGKGVTSRYFCMLYSDEPTDDSHTQMSSSSLKVSISSSLWHSCFCILCCFIGFTDRGSID